MRDITKYCSCMDTTDIKQENSRKHTAAASWFVSTLSCHSLLQRHRRENRGGNGPVGSKIREPTVLSEQTLTWIKKKKKHVEKSCLQNNSNNLQTTAGGSASDSLLVGEVVVALVALHGQLTRPPLLHLGPRRSLIVDGVHLAHNGLDTRAT